MSTDPPLITADEVLYFLGGIQNHDNKARRLFADQFFGHLRQQVKQQNRHSQSQPTLSTQFTNIETQLKSLNISKNNNFHTNSTNNLNNSNFAKTINNIDENTPDSNNEDNNNSDSIYNSNNSNNSNNNNKHAISNGNVTNLDNKYSSLTSEQSNAKASLSHNNDGSIANDKTTNISSIENITDMNNMDDIPNLDSITPNKQTNEASSNMPNSHISNTVSQNGTTNHNNNNFLNDGSIDNIQQPVDILKYSSSEEIEFYEDDDFFKFIAERPLSQNLYQFLPSIIQLRYTCPFSHVAKSCLNFIKLLQKVTFFQLMFYREFGIDIESRVPPLPALFLRNSLEFRLPPNCNEERKQLFETYFVHFGRISNLDIALSILPNSNYFRVSRELFYSLMIENNGPLNYEWRYYLALMAASRYDCKILISLLETQFQLYDADTSWLRSGLSAAPPKLSKITKLNALLAHQPWKINAKTISELVKGKNPWTVSEVVQAMVILVSYHLLCGLYHGLCLPPELDLLFQREFCRKMSERRESNNDIYLNPQDATGYNNNMNTNMNINNSSGLVQNNFDDFLDVLKEIFERPAHSGKSSKSNLKDEYGNEMRNHKSKNKNKRTRKNGGMGHSQSQKLKTLKMERKNKAKNETKGKNGTFADNPKSELLNGNGNQSKNKIENKASIEENITVLHSNNPSESTNGNVEENDNDNDNDNDDNDSRSVSPSGESNNDSNSTSDDNVEIDFESTQLAGNIDIEPPEIKKENDEEERNELIAMVKRMAENYGNSDDVSPADAKTKSIAFASAGDDFYEQINNRTNENETSLMEFDSDLAPPPSGANANGNGNGNGNESENGNTKTNDSVSRIINNTENGKQDNSKQLNGSTKVQPKTASETDVKQESLNLKANSEHKESGDLVVNFVYPSQSGQSLQSNQSGRSGHETPLLTSANWAEIVRLQKANALKMQSVDTVNSNNSNNNYNTTNNNSNNGSENKNESSNKPKVPQDLQTTKAEQLMQLVNKSGPIGRTNDKKKRVKVSQMTNVPSHSGIMYKKYSGGMSMCYVDFDCHKHPQIHLYDFNWQNHGFGLLSRYYPGIEKKLDLVFSTTQSMTDHTICGKKVDTELFRNAIWHYAFRLYGINNDSYDYKKVNFILKQRLKIFIKKICCYPQSVTIADIHRIGVKLLEHEKLHVALIALQAKQQACLLYGLLAVMKYMSSP